MNEFIKVLRRNFLLNLSTSIVSIKYAMPLYFIGSEFFMLFILLLHLCFYWVLKVIYNQLCCLRGLIMKCVYHCFVNISTSNSFTYILLRYIRL
jgi:hypothetical protein